jgi:succinate dehydrogenase/fumarate reductase flavoprotein subunit
VTSACEAGLQLTHPLRSEQVAGEQAVFAAEGCGQSDRDFDDVSIAAIAGDVAGIVRHCTSKPAVLNGWSLGGAVAVEAAGLLGAACAGVVLTCGGFENNQEMIRNYLPGVPYCYTSGSPYNEGDGITMAMSVGADLWHMNNYAGPSMALKVPEVRTSFSMQALHYSKEIPGGAIVVGPDGKRFVDEKFKTRHGKVPVNGNWLPLSTPCPMYLIFDHAHFAAGPLYDKHPSHGWTQIVERYDWSADNSAELAKGWIKTAPTIAALADVIGINPATLGATVDRWNGHCATGKDTEFGRTLMMTPIAPGPFYAIELSPSMLNTQGGPRRNERAQIVRPNGTPIPRLYSAGELGSIYSYLYQGTGNLGECLAFGRVSARNAVAEKPWDQA